MIGRDLPRQGANKAIRARVINRLGRALEDRSRGQLLAGNVPSLDGRVRRERGFFARLSGAANPYSFAEVYGQVSGSTLAWVAVPGGRTGTANAYEDNGGAGLDGQIVKVKPTELPAIWRFGFKRVGGPTPCVRIFGAAGCAGTLLPGKTIIFSQAGVVKASCTTADGTGGTTLGQCTVSLAPGAYDVSIPTSGGDGFAAYSAVFNHLCPNTGPAFFPLVSDSGHICISAACNYPIPKTLFTSDGLGSHTLVYGGLFGSSHQWSATATATAATKTIDPVTGLCVAGSGSFTVNYLLSWSPTLLWRLDMSAPIACCEYGDDGNARSGWSGVPAGSPGPCHPVNFVFPMQSVIHPTGGFGECSTDWVNPGGGGDMPVTQ